MRSGHRIAVDGSRVVDIRNSEAAHVFSAPVENAQRRTGNVVARHPRLDPGIECTEQGVGVIRIDVRSAGAASQSADSEHCAGSEQRSAR